MRIASWPSPRAPTGPIGVCSTASSGSFATGVFWWEIAIGIALGVLLGVGIVLAFVFLLSGSTIDAPSLSGP